MQKVLSVKQKRDAASSVSRAQTEAAGSFCAVAERSSRFSVEWQRKLAGSVCRAVERSSRFCL
jgi:hypothetical protein